MTREARRSDLLDAASRVLRRHGLDGLTFDSVADEAGVSKTLPYSYFDSAEAIAAELFVDVIGGIDARAADAVATARGFEPKVRVALEEWCDGIEADGRVVAALLDGRAVAAVRPLIEERDRSANRLWRDVVASEFELAEPDALLVATALTAGATAVLLLWVEEQRDRDDVVEDFTRLARGMASAFARRRRLRAG